MRYRKLQILFLLLVLPSAGFAQALIVNKNNPVSYLSKAEIRNIFLGNTTTWQNSQQIIISDYVAGSDLRKSFSSRFLDLSPQKVSMIWIKVSLAGKTVPPRVFHTESDLVNFVSENDGAIGYVESYANLPSNVKIIRIE